MRKSCITLFLALAGISLGVCVASAGPLQQPPPSNTSSTKPVMPVPSGTLGMALLSAYVGASGNLISGAGTTGSSALATGRYEVDFNRDVSQCFYAATNYDQQSLSIAAEPRFDNPNGVFIAIFNPSNTVENHPFNLIVFCSQ